MPDINNIKSESNVQIKIRKALNLKCTSGFILGIFSEDIDIRVRVPSRHQVGFEWQAPRMTGERLLFSKEFSSYNLNDLIGI